VADENQNEYLKRLGLWGLYALAVVAALAVNALLNKYIGSGQQVPPPPPPVVIVQPGEEPGDLPIVTVRP
jgi:hypothetical protein